MYLITILGEGVGKVSARSNEKWFRTKCGWNADVVPTGACRQPSDTGGKEPTVSQALTYFLQLLKTMRHEIQIYDFLKSYLWTPSRQFCSHHLCSFCKLKRRFQKIQVWRTPAPTSAGLNSAKGKGRRSSAFAHAVVCRVRRQEGTFMGDFGESSAG